MPEAVKKLKEEFNKTREVKDVRVIDMLCVKVNTIYSFMPQLK